MSARSHKIRVGQVEIYAEDTGQGSPALVFLHYWGGSRRTWTGVVEQLSDRFRCIAVDLRGWGKSDRHNEDYNLFTQADDDEGVIEELNLMDFVFVGHSMGGKIAQIGSSGLIHLTYNRMASFLAPYQNEEAPKVARDLDAKFQGLLGSIG